MPPLFDHVDWLMVNSFRFLYYTISNPFHTIDTPSDAFEQSGGLRDLSFIYRRLFCLRGFAKVERH